MRSSGSRPCRTTTSAIDEQRRRMRERADEQQRADRAPRLRVVDAGQRRRDRERRVPAATAAGERRGSCSDPSTDGPLLDRAVGRRGDARSGRRAARGAGSGSFAKPDGNERTTLPSRSRRRTASRRPASLSDAVRSGEALEPAARAARASSSWSTRSTRLARVSPTSEDPGEHERDRQHHRERHEQPASGGSSGGRRARRRRRGARSRSPRTVRSSRGSASSSFRRR